MVLTSSCNESFASTREAFITSSAWEGAWRRSAQSHPTQPEETNCLREEPLTARLRSVALSCTSRCKPPRGEEGEGEFDLICAASTEEIAPTAPSCTKERWFDESEETFFRAPAA